MKEATRIGIDLAKNIFHLVGMDACGGVVWRKALARRKLLEFLAQQKALEVGMEACHGALLGAGDTKTRAPGEIDSPAVCHALSQERQERLQ